MRFTCAPLNNSILCSAMTNVACRTGVIFVVFLLTSEQSIIECLASDALTSFPWNLSRIVTETNGCSNCLLDPLVGERQVALTSHPSVNLRSWKSRKSKCFCLRRRFRSHSKNKQGRQMRGNKHYTYIWLLKQVKRAVRPRKTSLRALYVFRPVGNLRMGRGPVGLYYNNKQNRINYIWHYNHEHMTVTFIR